MPNGIPEARNGFPLFIFKKKGSEPSVMLELCLIKMHKPSKKSTSLYALSYKDR